jgi:hypothetical protein
MAALSSFLINKTLDALLRGTAYVYPATVYIALFTTNPTAAGGGVEVAGGAYARVAVVGNLADWAGTQGAGTTAVSAGSSGATSNNNPVTFPAPVGAAWGVITGFAIFDAATAGNMLVFGALTTPKTVNNGDAAPSFPAGTLQFSLS